MLKAKLGGEGMVESPNDENQDGRNEDEARMTNSISGFGHRISFRSFGSSFRIGGSDPKTGDNATRVKLPQAPAR